MENASLINQSATRSHSPAASMRDAQNIAHLPLSSPRASSVSSLNVRNPSISDASISDASSDDAHSIPLQSLAGGSRDSSQPLNNASKTVQRHQLHRMERKPWIFIWKLELLAATFSVCCMASVIIILSVTQNKPLSHWKFPIQPNSLVSVFSTLSNFAMLLGVSEGISQLKWIYFQERRHRLFDLQVFDEASRGPLGSFRLLWMLKLHAVVASVGAIITIVALAMDPFTQQVLAFPALTVNATNATAALPIARAYDDRIGDGGGVDSNLDYDIVSGMTAAAFTGMFSPTNQVAFNCPSGNCTWPEYTTLGICNTCKIQTNLVDASCIGANYSIGTENCTYTFPNGLTIDAYASLNPGPQHLSPQQSTLLNISVIRSEDRTEKIANISVVQFAGEDEDWHLPKPVATGCEVTWCQKVFNGSGVVAGALHDFPFATETLSFLPCQTMQGSDAGAVTICPGFPVGHALPNWPQYNTTTLADPTAVWLNSADAATVGLWLQSMFTLSISSAEISSDDVLGNIVAKMLYKVNDGNMIETFDDIATAMTNVIRAGPNTTSLAGEIQTLEVFVHVRWAWLSLPLALVIFGVSFLAICIAFSAETGRGVWKSSSLAALFHGLRGWSEDDLDMRSEDEMKATARRTQVMLTTDSSGRVFFAQ